MLIDWLVNAFATLFVIIDPIGLAPIFLVLTEGMTTSDRRAIAWRASLLAAIILIVFAVVGEVLLETLGITISAFRVAGGLLLFWTAFEMVFEKREARKKKTATRVTTTDDIRQMAVFPLAIPLMAGPGAISATVLISAENPTLLGYGLLTGLILAIILVCFMIFLLAERIDPLLGETGRALLGRLLGVLLAALSVQFIIDGLTQAISLAGQ